MKTKIKSPPPFLRVDYYKGLINTKIKKKDLLNLKLRKNINKNKNYSKNNSQEKIIYNYNNINFFNDLNSFNSDRGNINHSLQKMQNDFFNLIYPFKIENISFGHKLNQNKSSKNLFNIKKLSNQEDIRFIEPKININDVLMNQRTNRNQFFNKYLIKNYHLKRSLLFQKNDFIKKSLTHNKFYKSMLNDSNQINGLFSLKYI
jgi:hypothetical protein